MYGKEFNDFISHDFSSFSKWLYSLNPYEFTLISTIIGFLIASTLDLNEQNSIGNFFELLGQVILTINAQTSTLQSDNNT